MKPTHASAGPSGSDLSEPAENQGDLLRLAEARLAESELRFRTLADSGQALIWTAGLDKKCDYFNAVWLRFTGRTLEQEMGDGWAEGVHPEDFERCVKTYVDAFDRREAFSMEYRLRHASGEYRWLQDDGSPRFDREGHFIGYIGYCLDITARRQAEEGYQTLFREMLDGFAVHEMIFDGAGQPVDYRFLAVNPAFERMTGLRGADIVGRTVLEVLPGTEKHWIETYGRVVVTGELIHFESYTATIGKHFQVTAFRPEANRFACMFADVTDRKRAEEARKTSEERLMQLAEQNRSVAWEMDDQGLYTYVSQVSERVFGYRPDELVGKKHFYDLHPEKGREAFREAAFREFGNHQPFVDFVNPVVAKDGRVVWVTTNGLPLFDGAGNWRGYRGSDTDITDRKRAEDDIRREQAFNKVIIDSIPGTFYMIDETGKYARWNAYQRDEIVGKPEEEVAQTHAVDTIHPDDREFIQGKIASVLQNGGVETVEGRVLLRGGPRYQWLLMTGRQLVVGGHPFLVGTGIDITERKRTEGELAQKMETLQRFQRLTVDREMAMIELKKEVNALLEQGGKAAKYKMAGASGASA